MKKDIEAVDVWSTHIEHTTQIHTWMSFEQKKSSKTQQINKREKNQPLQSIVKVSVNRIGDQIVLIRWMVQLSR